MSYIFISYSKGNITFARHLRSLLRAEGFSVWMDETRSESSNRWWYTIEANMIGAAAIILIVSPESKRSERVQNEMELARLNKKPIFPLLLGGNRWARFEDSEYVDMTAGLYASLPAHFVRSLKDFVPVNSTEPVPPPIPGERISTDEITLIPRRTRRTRRAWLALLLVVWLAFAAVAFLLVEGGLFSNGGDVDENDTATPARIALAAQDIEMTIDAEMALILTETWLTESAVAGAWTPVPDVDVRGVAFARLTATQSMVNQTLTAEHFTEMPTATRTPRPSATADERPVEMTLSAAQEAVASATQLIANLTATAESYTATPTVTATPTETNTPTATRTPRPSATADGRPVEMTLSAAQEAIASATQLIVDLTATAESYTATPTATDMPTSTRTPRPSATADERPVEMTLNAAEQAVASATQLIVDLTATAESYTATPAATNTPTVTRTPRPSATADERPVEMTLNAAEQAVASATQLIANLTATAESYTATPTATDMPTSTRTPRPSRTPVPTEDRTAVAAQDALATALKLLDDLTATATTPERTPEDGLTAGWTEGMVLYIQEETGPSGVAGRDPAPNRVTQYQPGDTVTLGVAPVAPEIEREWYIVPQTGERWWFIGDRGGGWVPERVLGSTPPG